MPTLFSKIIAGEIPCFKIAEDENYFAFMDIRPVNTGHILVIPKDETDYIFDLPDPVLEGLLTFAKPIAKALEKVVPCERIGIMVAGLEVPHAHIHLIPMTGISDLNFANAKDAEMDHLKSLADEIKKQL
ncbi:MAG: HIT family protein [Lentisphaeria bacterium]|nr:HIT family protein [Lentisphaeria bacterium]NQZ69431.1 HIT family protein [Lentisphaeria bacterium]